VLGAVIEIMPDLPGATVISETLLSTVKLTRFFNAGETRVAKSVKASA
jgi:hypothetical protein